MAVRRFNANDNDSLVCSIGTGGMDQVLWGAFTVVAIAKRESGHTFGTGPVLDIRRDNSRGTFRYTDDSPQRMNYLRGSFDSPGDGQEWSVADGWVLVAWTRPAGDSTVRYHKCVLSSDTWTHQNSAGTVDDDDNVATGIGFHIYNDTDFGFHGLIAARATWDAELGAGVDVDAAIEALRDSYQDWLGHSTPPIFAQRLDQASTSTALVDDTSNGADQTSISGTSVVTGDDPPGFTFDSGPTPEEVDLSPGVMTFTPVALTLVPGEVTMSLSPGVMTFTPVAVATEPGEVTITLSPGVLTFTPVGLVPLSAGNLMLSPGVLTFQGVPVTFAHGTVTMDLSPGTLQFVPVPIGELGAEVDMTIVVAPSRIGSVLVAPSRADGTSVGLTREARGN